MNDIAKMREEFEQKIKYAQIENKINEGLEPDGIRISVIGASCTSKDRLHISVRCVNSYTKGLDIRQMGCVLCKLPVTESYRSYTGVKGGYVLLPYEMQTHRGGNEFHTSLNVRWISNEFEVWATMSIDEKDEEIMQFFKETTRELTDTEVQLYCNGRTRWNYNRRNFHRFLTFNCGSVVKFQGGYHKQISEGILNSIAETLKYRYEFSE